ncbi:hypothetical protein [Hyphococcus lacteus]|uniref:DUF2946 domain-containing protein n=1 Tax=Hyphococcus lacteus TaxID=3143536 RepID=A0ABV3Z3S0_9PROT
MLATCDMWVETLKTISGMLVIGLAALAMLLAPVACARDCGFANDIAHSAGASQMDHSALDGDEFLAACCSICSVHVFFRGYEPELSLALFIKYRPGFLGRVAALSPDGPFRPPRG